MAIFRTSLALVCLTASFFAGLVQARPAFEDPPTVDGKLPIRVLATSPKNIVKIEGFVGQVRGLMLYGINGAEPSLSPALWRTEPGGTLQIRLENDLPCVPAEQGKQMRPDQTNLHVHGLMVYANSKDALGRYGDNSMLVVDSQRALNQTTGRYRCGTRSLYPPYSPDSRFGHSMHPREYGVAFMQVSLPQDHPYGLSWYHPHVHEVTGYQVGGGMSGLIAIGDIWNYAYAKYSELSATQSDEAQLPADERAHSSRKRLGEEERLRSKTRTLHVMLKDLQLRRVAKNGAENTYQYTGMFAPDLCGAGGKQPPLAREGVCRSKDGRSAWLFTVNGQLMPRITVPNGQRQVWRVANVSATVSYQLRLKVRSPQRFAGRVIPLQVLASDGVAFQNTKAQANYQDDFHVLPSARLDLHLDPMHVCRQLLRLPDEAGRPCVMEEIEAVLETAGPNLGADTWPHAELALVQVQAIQTYRSEDDPGPMGTFLTKPQVLSRSVDALPLDPPCNNGSKTLTANQYRLIGVWNGGAPGREKFGMQTDGPYELVAGQPSVTKLKLKKYQAFKPSRIDLCVWADIKNKYAEHWLIKNDSQEVHNFHLHQAKFEVISHEDGPRPKVPSRGSGPGNAHDNYPINPGGWVLLKIRFDRPEQAGIYMYHCHILEHEDKGMMSMIQVVDTSVGLTSAPSASQRSAALARYLAEAPPWMKGAVCQTPR